MPPMEGSEIGTLEKIPIWPTNPSTGNRRRRPLRSRTVDTLLHILSVCYADSSHITQNSDKDDTHIESVTKDDVLFTCTNIISNDSEHQEETNVAETRVILGTQEESLCNTNLHVEPVEQDHNISEESLDLSSPHLDTNKDVEEGEISGEFTNLVPEDNDVESVDKTGSEEHEDFTGINSGFEKNNSLTLTPLSINKADDIVSANNLINNATKNQDFGFPIKDKGAQNNKKRQRSCNDEKGTNKKAKKSVDQSTCPEGLTKTGENPEDASANKDADTKKKREAGFDCRKKSKEKAKRKNQTCHEGENCKFSHDTTPLTKSKPCCHFARHSCMKGDECPFDHQLSKYPCNNYLSKGFCPRGSDCMFSHEAQPSEASLNPLNESTSEQKLSSKLQINNHTASSPKPSVQIQPPKGVTFISREKIDTKPKSSPQPPKGISFLSQEKLPLEAQSSPKVNSEGEMTKTPPEIPRGINFLSFGKKHSDDGFSFKIGKSPLSKPEGIIVNVDDGVKVVTQIDNSDKIRTNSEPPARKPMPVLPFLSSTSRRTLESTLAFAAKFDSSVKGI
ncbi:unnamed protein product [Lactuca virosa]|uniref:C3H1-type domain-containing protein n=1 Tax=Lactuca virosa TaxID=75947 RepID=A0AAU9PFC5_9ASTR|nr:unnamed protein product [Lactuca virosa]